MTDRVEQERLQKQAAEAERLQKRAEKDMREHKASETNREAFSKLVKTTQQGTKTEKDQTEKAQSESKQNESAQKTSQKAGAEAERAARMARGGVVQHSRVMEQA